MDDLDNKLLLELQSDPRMHNAKLAKLLGVTEHTIGKRIERLVSSGEVLFTALPNMKLFGFATNAYIAIKLYQKAKPITVAELLSEHPQIRYIGSCNGFADLFIGVNFQSNEALSDFISEDIANIDGIAQINTMIEMKMIKEPTYGRLEIQGDNQKGNNQIITSFQNNEIDALDRMIILELQRDGRTPLKQLARLTNKSEQTLSRRIKKLITSGAIRMAAMQGHARIKTYQNIIIGIDVEFSKLGDVAKTLVSYPLIGSTGIYSGPYQILTYLLVPSSEEASNFINHELTKINGIKRIEWLVNLNVIKRGFAWIR